MRINSIVANDVGIQLESLASSCVVLGIRAVTRPWVGAGAHLVHVHVLHHHTLGTV